MNYKTDKKTCPHCMGTGIENEEARNLWMNKDPKDLTFTEIYSVFGWKIAEGEIKYVRDIKLKNSEIIKILQTRGTWNPCHKCNGKGVI